MRIFRYRSAVVGLAHHDETAKLIGELTDSDRHELDETNFKERYICSRAMLRRLMRENSPANDTIAPLRRTASGRPVLDGCSWHVSFSHADSWSIAAIALRPVGIDIERRDRRVDWESIAATQLPASAVERLAWSTPEDRREAFLREWTQIEACAKQFGMGLSLPVLETDLTRDCAHFLTEELIGCITVASLSECMPAGRYDPSPTTIETNDADNYRLPGGLGASV